VERGNQRTEDWAEVIDRMLEGEPAACLQISRLLTGFLVGWRAYDFRDAWPDLVQEVVLALITAGREGKIRNREASLGYIRTVAHHKFVDHLRRHLRRSEDQNLPWGDTTRDEGFEARTGAAPEDLLDLKRAMQKLPERSRDIVFGVYGQGKTYEQVAQESGTPLGSLKRYLRDGLAELRKQLAGELEHR
jgi:RNA polymerase sigma-70 factor (ECF subfamily)